MARKFELNKKQKKAAEHLRKQNNKMFRNRANDRVAPGKKVKKDIKRNKTDKKDFTSMNLLCDALALNGVQNLYNIKQKQIDTAIKFLHETGYSTSQIKSTVGAVNKVAEEFNFKNKLQESSKVFERLGIENKRSNGNSERIWSDREYMEMMQRAKELGRPDVIYGMKLARNGLLRGMELTNLTVGQIEEVVKTGKIYLIVTKGSKPREFTVSKTFLEVCKDLDIIAKTEHLNKNDLIFCQSELLTRGNPGIKANEAQSAIQNFIYKNAKDIQDEDRKGRDFCEQAAKDGFIYKSDLTLHGLRGTGAYKMINNFLDKGIPERKAKNLVSHVLGHGNNRNLNCYIKQANVRELDKQSSN